MKLHNLRILPKYYEKVLSGEKTFEIRKDDRGFEVGDKLILKEYIPGYRDLTGFEEVIIDEKYTGREVQKEISYVLKDAEVYGLKRGFCILAIKD